MNNEFLRPDDDYQVDTSFTGDVPLKDPSLEAEKKASKGRVMLAAVGLGVALVLSIVFVLTLYYTGVNTEGALGFLGANVGMTQLILLGLATFFGLVALFGIIACLVNSSIAMKLPFSKSNQKRKKIKLSMLLAATSIVSLVLAVVIFISASKAIPQAPVVEAEPAIVTTPAETINLLAPIEIEFKANELGIDLDKFEIIAYKWDFGDGATSTGDTVLHEYTFKDEDGVFEVSLDVSYKPKDKQNVEAEKVSFQHLVSIANIQSSADFVATPASPKAQEKVTFDASSSSDEDGEIILYEWDILNDGTIDGEGVEFSHSFAEPGLYEVKLLLTDNNSQTAEKIMELEVRSANAISPVVLTNPSDEVLVPGRNYQFDASSSSSVEGSIERFEWNFGDGKQRVGSKVNYTFVDEGLYEVILKLNDSSGNEFLHKRTYTVSTSPSGMFPKITSVPASEDGKVSGVTPLRISFDAGQSGGKSITDFAWDFDDDGVIDANGQNVEHLFGDPGEYQVRLLLTSSEGKTAETLLQVEVLDVGLNVRVQAEPNIGEVPLTVKFDATSTIIPKGVNVVAYRWNFGDETPILREGPIVTHKFNKIGDFEISVTAITDKNDTAEGGTTVFVNAIPLKACFKSSRVTGKVPLTVEFDPHCSTGNVASFAWDFGDNNALNERKAKHTFEIPGEYEVQLEVSDGNNNIDTFSEKILVLDSE